MQAVDGRFAPVMQRIADLTASDDDWRWAAWTVATAGSHRHVEEILTYRHRVNGDGGAFAYDLAFNLATTDRGDVVRHLAAAFDQDSAFWGIFSWMAGLDADLPLSVQSRMLRRGVLQATQAAMTVFANDSRFLTYLYNMQIQANLLEPGETAGDSLLPCGLCAPLPPLGKGDGTPVVMAACDEKYLRQYGARLAESFSALSMPGDLLVIVVNPTADEDAFRADLIRRFPRLAFGFVSGPATPQFYACARFLFASAVLAAYERQLIIVDVDGVFPRKFGDLVQAARCGSVGLPVVKAAKLPSLRISAAVVAFTPGAQAGRFLNHVEGYLHAKLQEDYTPWMVDQAALYNAFRLSLDGGGGIDLNTLLPDDLRLPESVSSEHELSMDERVVSRGIGRIDVRFDHRGYPLFSVQA